MAFNKYEQDTVETARRRTALAVFLVCIPCPRYPLVTSSDKSPYLWASGPFFFFFIEEQRLEQDDLRSLQASHPRT